MKLLPFLMLFVALCQFSLAQEQTIEATVVSVDAAGRALTVRANGEDKEFEVLKKAFVKVGDSHGTLADVKPGHTVTMNYDAKLEVVTAIAVTGNAIARPEMVEITEPPQAQRYSSPWIAPDGLSLYFSSRQNEKTRSEICVMTRESSTELFANPKKIMAGTDLSLTADELEIMFTNDGVVYSSTRKAKSANFSRPEKVAELTVTDTIVRPRLSPNGLVVYLDNHPKKGTPQPHFSTRKNRTSPWTSPKAVVIPTPLNGKIRNITLLDDNKTALAAMSDLESKGDTIVELTMVDFGKVKGGKPLQVPGLSIFGTFPNYAPKTKELYLLRPNGSTQTPQYSIVAYRNLVLR